MAILNSVSALFGAITPAVSPSVAAPGSMWHLLILNVFSFVADYGWRIVVFTVLLKLVLSPLDFYQRYKMHKNQKITERLKPTMEKLQKQYAGDKQAFSQKQMELNRKEGYSYFSSCLPMIATMVIFITLWISMQTIAEYMTFKEYTTLYDEYQYAYEQMYEDSEYRLITRAEMEEWTARAETDEAERDRLNAFIANHPNNIYTQEDRDALPEAERAEYNSKSNRFNAIVVKIGQEIVYKMYYDGLDESYVQTLNATIEQWKNDDARLAAEREAAIAAGEDVAEYVPIVPDGFALPDGFKLLRDGTALKKVQASFLWIKNIWAPDVPWGDQAILDWSTFVTGIDDYKEASTSGLGTQRHSDVFNQSMYERVMGKLLGDTTQSRTNGYLILPILVVLLSLGSQLLSMFQQKRAGQVNAKGGTATSMKVMMVIMPIMMAVFAIQYASIFSLYMTVNSATTLFFNFLFTGIIRLIDKAKRNRKNGIATGSSRSASKQSPIIHYVKGANPNAGAKVTVAAQTDDVGKKSKKDKKSDASTSRTVVRGGRPDPNDLMNTDMSVKSKKKK